MLTAILQQDPSGSLVSLLDRYGVPVVLLAIIGWGLYKTATWLAPRIDRLINRHEKLLDTLEVELSNSGELLKQHGELLVRMDENQSRVLECLNELRRTDAGTRAVVRELRQEPSRSSHSDRKGDT